MIKLKLLQSVFVHVFFIHVLWINMAINTGAYAQSLKVMTYNIRLDTESDGANAWKHRKDFLSEQIRYFEPDVLGIQEALPNQVADLCASLPDYSFIGVGRDGNNKGESSNIFYRKNRFSVTSSGTFWLSSSPDTVSMGWDAACNRVCSYARFYDKTLKQHFWAFNTHLDHIGKLARSNGTALILSRIKSLNIQNDPVIFTGDFNATPDDEIIHLIKEKMNDSRDVSIQKPFGPSGTFNGFRHDEAVTKRIDYIFISKKNPFTVSTYAVLSDAIDLRYPSDHLPVLTVFILK